MKKIALLILSFVMAVPVQAASLSHLEGRILLQVEQNGEAFYYSPKTSERHYLGRPADAFEIMRSFGLGITNADLDLIPTENESSTSGDSSLRDRLAGEILLQVEENGEAWYVYPVDKKRYYLGRPSDAFSVMRTLGLGISDSDLATIAGDVVEDTQELASNTTPEATPEPEVTTPVVVEETVSVVVDPSDSTSDVEVATAVRYRSRGDLIPGDGTFQKGTVPAGVNYATINQWFVNRINAERASRGQFKIVSDQRMVDTASVWAEQMYLQDEITHTRLPENMIAREWVWENFELEFAENWGWMYENIGGGSYSASSNINQSIIDSLDSLIDYFISEESYNGIHFQTIMHDHLTHVGVGFYFEGDDQSGKLWTVMHYAALSDRILPIDRTY